MSAPVATGPQLTAEQVALLKTKLVPNGVPCRFSVKGRNLNIVTGYLAPANINVLYMTVYWGFDRETAKQIAQWLDCTVWIESKKKETEHG